ncbi:hypothetical protein [Streptomyces javensis]|uniref:hypothetical protein n=1 Tax=Streptomyces javensis TaxID=114698 RepID=UPI00337B321A
MTPDTAPERRALADRLQEAGVLAHPKWRAAVEAVPRELFLRPGVFLPADDGHWRPATALGTDPKEWSEIAYRDECEREAKVPPTLLEEWMPAFLAQLAAPGAQVVHAARPDGIQ